MKKSKVLMTLIMLFLVTVFISSFITSPILASVLEFFQLVNAGKAWSDHVLILTNAVVRSVGGKFATTPWLKKIFLPGTGVIQTTIRDPSALGYFVYASATVPAWLDALGHSSKFGWPLAVANLLLRAGYSYAKNWETYRPPVPPIYYATLPNRPGGDHPDEFAGIVGDESLAYKPFEDVFTNFGYMALGSLSKDPSCDSQLNRFHNEVRLINTDYDSHLALLVAKSEEAYQAACAIQEKVCLLAGTTDFPYFSSETDVNSFLNNLSPEERTEIDSLNKAYAEKLIAFEDTAVLILDDYRRAADAVILTNGYCGELEKLVNKLHFPNYTTEITGAFREYNTLIIPTGGLYGLDSSASFRQNLANYVQNGGTLICFAQQHGYEFNALPGGEVSGYGWNEDQSCHTNAAYIDTYHPMFAGQDSASLDANVDGYFTNWPDNATVLLRRTKNGMPAMIVYPYGNGWVVASSLYSDFSYAHGGITQDEVALIRDLISWAKNPDREIKEYKPGEMVSINVQVTNHSDSSSDNVILTLLDPNRNTISTTMVVHSLNPRESTEIPFPCTASLPLGIWWVDYALKDFSGNTIQPESEGERFQVSYHYESPKSPDISFSISAPSEYFSKGSEGIFTFHIWNHGETDRDLTVKYHFPHHYQQTGDPIYGVKSYSLSNSVHVVVGSEASFVYVVPIVTNDQLFSKIYDEGGDEIGYSNFKIWALDLLVSTKIQTDKIEYSPRENVNVSLSMQNLQPVVCDATVKLSALDPDNVIIFEKDIYLHLEENGSVVETASFTLSADSKKGQYVIRVETESGGDIIDSACCYFEIPMATLSIVANVPESFSLISPISFIVSNVGEVNVSDGELQVSLEDPDKSLAWNETRQFALQAGESANFDFLVSLSEAKFGDYRLINRITTEGRPTSSGSIALPCSASTQISFDKLLYKTREPLSLNLEVTNTGKFEEPLEIILNIPTCNFTQSQKVTLLPNQSTNIPYSLTIPDTAPAGTNSVEVMLKMGNTLSRTFNFAIQSSKLVLSLDKLEYAVGESGEIKIENQGGVDADYDYTIKIVDLKGVVVSEDSGTGSIQWGASQTIGFSLASSQIVDGEYLLSCLVQEEKLNKKTPFERYIKVKGLTASLVASTDKKTYFKGEPVETSAKITPSGGTISDGSLKLKIYSPNEKWAEYPDLKGTTYIVPENGVVWFGTVSGKLIKYDKAKGDWATYSLPSDGIYGNYVYCLAVDVNYVWVGTRSGLMRWDKVGKSWKVYTSAQGLSNITVISLANDGNYLWVGAGWGLNRMDKINETFQYYTTSDGLVDNQVRSIAVDGNFVWIGSLNGVSRFNKADSSWQTFTKGDGLADNRVRAIVVEDSYVWFATQGGVSRFEKETSSWGTFTVSEGLVSNDVYSIGVDGTYIWFGTYEGLSRFDRIGNSWKTFTTQDGLASNFVRIIVVDGYEIWFIAGEIS